MFNHGIVVGDPEEPSQSEVLREMSPDWCQLILIGLEFLTKYLTLLSTLLSLLTLTFREGTMNEQATTLAEVQ